MNLRLIVLVLVLAALAAGTWWMAERLTPTPHPAPAATHAPDYYFTDATVTTLDKQGRRAAVMTAPRIEHHPDDDSSEVFAPRITYYSAGDPPWHAAADHGLMPGHHSPWVRLTGHVEMRRPATGNGAPLLIQTDKLNVNLDTNIGTTSDPVEITQGTSLLTGVGMTAYFKDNRLILVSKVRGHYVTAH